MLIIHVDQGESIEKALKRYKNKHRSVRMMDEIRQRKHFTKPSVKRRNQVLDAAYREKTRSEFEG